MSVRWAPISAFAHLRRDPIEVRAGESYRTLGLLNRGRGVFTRPEVAGTDTKYPRLFRVRPRQLIYSKLFGWEGSVAVVPDGMDGYCVSPEFPVFDLGPQVLPEFVRHLVSWSGFAEQLAATPTGLGQRRQRVNVSDFEAIKVPLPDLDEQRRIAAHLDAVHREAVSIRYKVSRHPSDVRTLLPRLVGRLLRAEIRSWVPLSELCSNINRTVHPGEDRRGADEFVGLEHIESHTGRRLGVRALGEEKGRKLYFEPGQVTYGYLRPYLNKAWAADRVGLCSVEQYVLNPGEGVGAELLGHVLRSSIVLDAAVEATHSLQLPRLRLDRLMEILVPDVRESKAALALTGRLDNVRSRIEHITRVTAQRSRLLDSLLPAARNEVFSAMR